MKSFEARSIQTIMAAAFTMLMCYLGIVAVPVIILCMVMMIDYATGMISAWKNSELSSKKGILGIIKKVCYLAMICVGMGVDWLIYSGITQIGIEAEHTVFFGVLVTVWLIINELISILENLRNIGVPLPKFLVTIVKRLKVSVENKFEGEDDKND